MKPLLQHPFMIYVAAGIGALAIMIIIDYILGSEAEHLNAWVILNRLMGRDRGLPDSLAIRKFGLYGAVALMLAVNTFLGLILINLLKLLIKIIHLF